MEPNRPAGEPSRRTFVRGLGGTLGAFALAPAAPPAPAGGTAPKPGNDPGLPARARALMRDAIVIDAYNCGAYARHRQEPPGWFTERGKAQVDLIKALEGGVT